MKNSQVRKNIKKWLLKALIYTILVLIFLPPGLAFLFHEPLVQTLSGKLATHWLSSKTGNNFSVSAIQVGLNNKITLKGVLVKDHKDSTLMKVDELKASPVYADWGMLGIVFSKVELNGVEFRLARYKESDELNLLLLIEKFGKQDNIPTNKEKSSPFKLKMKKLLLNDALFQYYDETRDFDLNSDMNYSNILFDSIYLKAKNFVIVNDSLSFKIENLNTNELSGIKIRDMQTDFSISNSGLQASRLLLTMNNSKLDLDFGFIYNSYQSYRYFIDSVVIYADIRPSEVLMSDIGFFTHVMKPLTNELGITGKVYGTISNFNGDDVRVHYKNRTRISVNAQITGLPDFYSSRINAKFNEISTTPCELKSLYLPLKDNHLDFTQYFKCNDLIKFKGSFDGFYNDFKTDFKLQTGEGDLAAEILYTEIENDTVNFEIHARGDSISLGKFSGLNDMLGDMNFYISAKGRGKSWNDIKIKSEGTLRSFDFMKYNYSRLRYTGRFYKNRAEGNIVVGDKNLMMSADAVADFKKVPEIGIVANIRRAHLDNLNLWKAYDISFSTEAALKMKGLQPDTMTGKLVLTNSNLNFGKSAYKLENVVLDKKLNATGQNLIELKSDFADLSLKGEYNITTLGDRIISLINHYMQAIPQEDSIRFKKREYADLDLILYNDALIENHFVPGLSLSPETRMVASADFGKNSFDLSASFDKLVISGIEMRENKLNIFTKNKLLSLNYSNENTIFRDSTSDDKTVFGLDNFQLNTNTGKDSLHYMISWDNKDSLLKNAGDLAGYYRKTNENDYFKILQSAVYVNDTLWAIDPENLVVVDTTGAYFENMIITGGDSRMNLRGKIPRKNNDSLVVVFDNWNLSNFDMVTRLWRFDLDGIINGDFQYGILNENPVIASDIVVDNFALNKEFLGKAELLNKWDNKNQFISIRSSVTRSGTSGEAEVVSILGKYYPFKDEDNIKLDASFNRIKVSALEPFFADFISQLEGVAAGELKLEGSASKPVLTGHVDMHRTQLLINYLNTKYSFSNVINFEKDKISFDELVIYDTLGNYANVDGSLKHKYFENTAFDVRVSTQKLLAFNTSRKMNELYYGTGLVAGDLTVGGNAKNITLNMNMSTLDGTDVKLPLDYSIEISDKDYIIFVNHQDSIQQDAILLDELEAEAENEELQYAINMDLTINPQAKVTIYMPSEMGWIESEGTGKINMKTNSNGDFSLIGDYTVVDGLFHFSLAKLVSKRFELVEGGRISWTGDPYAANLNIKGLYKVKTNLSSLGITIDSTANFRNKANVDCYVILRNQLLNPDIRFDIQFPELNPDLQRMVYAELDTTNQAMMNEQMISLLVLGTFSYSNASNINLGSAAYYSVLTNQLSSMLSKISDDFDIGVNYKPGDQVSQEEFEVALSTQLFDDRLMIDGNLGMTYDRSGQNASNIVGDVDIGYKITEDGQWILRAFNHSNVNSYYNYSGYDKVAPYTQGIGIAFRREFTHISELFKRNKPKKKNNDDDKNNKEATIEEN